MAITQEVREYAGSQELNVRSEAEVEAGMQERPRSSDRAVGSSTSRRS